MAVLSTYVLTVYILGIPYTRTTFLGSVFIPVIILPVFIISDYRQKLKIIKTNRMLVSVINEKNQLIHEVHHRVRNNLAIILSILHLQDQKSRYRNDPEYSRISFERRIQTMSLVYNLILKSPGLDSMNLKQFLLEQQDYITDILENPYIQVELVTDPENISVSLANAVPVGLIISEICINSFQHAFSGSGTGKITVRAVCSNSETVLTIRDNGAGIPRELLPYPPATIGLNLVAALADQIKGSYSIENENGTVFTMVYRN